MKLTNENIKAALDVLGDISYQEFVVLGRERRQALNTCMKALDACRWRDAGTEPPKDGEIVVVRTDYKIPYDIDYMLDGEWQSNGGWAKVLAWLPLPEWEASDE